MIVAIHVFFDSGRNQGWTDGSYDNEGSALRGLAELFYHDPRSAFDYWHTAILDKKTGKTTYLDWTYAAERRAAALKQRAIADAISEADYEREASGLWLNT